MSVRLGTLVYHRFGWPDDEAPVPSDYQSIQYLPTIVYDPSGDFKPGTEFRALEINYMLNLGETLAIGTVIRVKDTIYTVQIYSQTKRVRRCSRGESRYITKVHSRFTLLDCDGHEWRGRRECIGNGAPKDLA